MPLTRHIAWSTRKRRKRIAALTCLVAELVITVSLEEAVKEPGI
jgi:hypothetical protein